MTEAEWTPPDSRYFLDKLNGRELAAQREAQFEARVVNWLIRRLGNPSLGRRLDTLDGRDPNSSARTLARLQRIVDFPLSLSAMLVSNLEKTLAPHHLFATLRDPNGEPLSRKGVLWSRIEDLRDAGESLGRPWGLVVNCPYLKQRGAEVEGLLLIHAAVSQKPEDHTSHCVLYQAGGPIYVQPLDRWMESLVARGTADA